VIENRCLKRPQQGTLELWMQASSALRCLGESFSPLVKTHVYIISRIFNLQRIKVGIQLGPEITLYFLYALQNARNPLYGCIFLECDRYLFDSLECLSQCASNPRTTCRPHRQRLGSFLILFHLDVVFQLRRSID